MIGSVHATVETSVVEVDFRPSASATMQGCGASPEARLLALMVYNQLVDGKAAETTINLSQEQLKELREAVREALRAAKEAQEDSGFWGAIGDVFSGDIATIAEVVVIAAASVATGGAVAIALGAIAIGCTLAAKYADELGIPPNVAIVIGIAAALASVGSGGFGAGASAASFAGAGGAASVGGEVALVSGLKRVADGAKLVASVVSPAAVAAGAVAHGVSGYYAGEVVDHNADAKRVKSDEKLESMNIDDAIRILSEAIDRQLAAFQGVGQSLQADQRTNQLIYQNYAGTA